MVLKPEIIKWYLFNLNANICYNQINTFTVGNLYPVLHTFSSDKEIIFSDNVKFNNKFHSLKTFNLQVTAVYLAPNIIPHGKIGQRLPLYLGLKKIYSKRESRIFFQC